MDIRVSGHQMDTGEALQSHANQRLTAIVDKYFSRALSSHVTFGRAPAGGFRCDIIMHVMHNLVLKATGTAQDAHLALDQAAEGVRGRVVGDAVRREAQHVVDRSDHANGLLGEDCGGRADILARRILCPSGINVENAGYGSPCHRNQCRRNGQDQSARFETMPCDVHRACSSLEDLF